MMPWMAVETQRASGGRAVDRDGSARFESFKVDSKEGICKFGFDDFLQVGDSVCILQRQKEK